MKCSYSAKDLAAHLNRQLIFLRNSVAAYDKGCVEGAIRIGVVIRVIFHDTKNSVSLLKLMNRKSTLKLVTTAKTLSNDLLSDMDFVELMAGMVFGSTLEYAPVSDDSSIIPCLDWWKQTVFIRDNKSYTREDIVLLAANKDGGAHIHKRPDGELQVLQESFWEKVVTYPDGMKRIETLSDNHFRMLRRFAGELLSSKDLLDLAGKKNGMRG